MTDPSFDIFTSGNLLGIAFSDRKSHFHYVPPVPEVFLTEKSIMVIMFLKKVGQITDPSFQHFHFWNFWGEIA